MTDIVLGKLQGGGSLRVERELSNKAVAFQVDALEAYVERGGDALRWLLSKDFTAADTKAIRDEWRRRQRRATA